MKKIFKIFSLVLIIFFLLLLSVFCFFSIGSTEKQKNITWGVDFSQMQAESLKLDWKQAYLAIINDLGAKNIKLHTQWDWTEGEKDSYYFDDIDWQIQRAKENGVKIIYVVGLKTGRWPECHMPAWANNLSEQEQKNEILNYIKETVLRYKDNDIISYWQVENEPLFKFGQCPAWYYRNEDFLKTEVGLIKSLDSSRQVIISDSGEQSPWFDAAKIGDVVGTTMYRKVWIHIVDGIGFYYDFFIRPIFYHRKAEIIGWLFNKKVICVELQAEPWLSKPFFDMPLAEQEKSMNLNQFKKSIDFAEQTGMDQFYLWGAEWWYWLKTVQDKPEIWNEAKKLFIVK